MRKCALLLAISLLPSLLSLPATAAEPTLETHLADARAHKAALRYQEGLASLDAALALGRAGPAELRFIHQTAGELAAGLDRADEAEAHFRRYLLLEPDATLPPGTSPKIAAPFAAARAWVAGHGGGLRLALQVRDRAGEPRALVLVVESDPLGWVAGLRLRAAGGGAVTESRQGPPFAALLADTRVELTAAAIDAHGNELWRRAVIVPARVATTGAAPRPLLKRPWLWGAVAAGFAAGGTLFALEVDDAEARLARVRAEPGMHTLDEVEEIRSDGRRNAWLANGCFAAAGAAAITGAILLFSDDGGEARGAPPAPTITPIAGEGGMIGLSLQGHY